MHTRATSQQLWSSVFRADEVTDAPAFRARANGRGGLQGQPAPLVASIDQRRQDPHVWAVSAGAARLEDGKLAFGAMVTMLASAGGCIVLRAHLPGSSICWHFRASFLGAEEGPSLRPHGERNHRITTGMLWRGERWLRRRQMKCFSVWNKLIKMKWLSVWLLQPEREPYGFSNLTGDHDGEHGYIDCNLDLKLYWDVEKGKLDSAVTDLWELKLQEQILKDCAVIVAVCVEVAIGCVMSKIKKLSM